MKIKARCSFVGTVCMVKNEVMEVSEELASDLISAGYAEVAGSKKPQKAVKRGENQRGEG